MENSASSAAEPPRAESAGDGGAAHASTDGVAAAAVKIAPKKNLRKRPRDDEDGSSGHAQKRRALPSESSDEEEHVDLTRIRELRAEQKLRGRSLGVDSTAMLSAEPVDVGGRAAAVAGPQPASAAAAVAAAAVESFGLSAADSLASGQFNNFSAAGSSAGPAATESAGMQAFIEKRLRELKGGSSKDGSSPAASTGGAHDSWQQSGNGGGDNIAEMLADPSKLYTIPEHLVPRAPLRSGPEDVGAGGMMLGGTGITEVALPEEFKRKNVEETERAAVAMLARRAAGGRGYHAGEDGAGGGGGDGGPAIPSTVRFSGGSITANYNQHRKETAMRMQGKVGDTALFDARDVSGSGGHGGGSGGHGGGGAGGQRGGHGGKFDKRTRATDDAAFSQFRKREIFGSRN